MAQTGVMKVRLADGSWKHIGFPNPGNGVFKVHDGDMWHYADNAATVRTGRLKVNIGGGVWQHVSWMRGPEVPIDALPFRGENHHDFNFTVPAGAHPLPLPAGTQIGDLMVLSLSPNNSGALGWTMDDPRFTDYGHGAYVGRATDLSDVQLSTVTADWLQAIVVVFAQVRGAVHGVAYRSWVSGDGALTLPVVPGVKVAVCCEQATVGVVAGWVYPSNTGTGWAGGPYASSGVNGYAGLSYWDDPTATDSPATPCVIDGSIRTAGVTVIGFR